MRRKQLTDLDSNLNKTKEVNAKVKVQYIQEQHQLIQKLQNSEDHQHKLLSSMQEDPEIENVEYLEDNPNVEFIDEHSEKDDFEDNFYPNAIHCLLDLYKTKYENLHIEGEINLANIWRDIAKNMQESFFEFNESQVQQKYLLLREQYLAVKTKEDIDNFDYFEQLHCIYRDPGKEAVMKGLVGTAAKENVYYKDEVLLNSSFSGNNHVHDFKSDEIVHKEHEFINMVEKELQTIEDGGNNTEKNEKHFNEEDRVINGDKKSECNAEKQEHLLGINKKLQNDLETNCGTPPRKKQKFDEYFKVNENMQDNCSATSSNDFSLYLYNQHQERRHREKMSMLEKYFKMQERALEQQQHLIQELIKRLPS